MWSVPHLRPEMYQFLKRYQKVNHFPRSAELCKKERMYKNIEKMHRLHQCFDFVPKTFALPQELPQLLEESMADDYWVIKPLTGQGKESFITSDASSIPNTSECIASKYIADPLLIEGHKFDLQIYVALTSIEPLKLYVYNEGFAVLSPYKFPANKSKVCSVNSSSRKLTLAELNGYLEAQGIDCANTWNKVDEIVVKAVLSIEEQVKSACDVYVPFKSNCFELLEFSILIDKSLKPWLLKVSSPALNINLATEQQTKNNLVADLLTLIGIVPLDQRTLPKKGAARHGMCATSGMKRGKTVKLTKLRDNSKNSTKQEAMAIHEMEAEFKRRGRFRRVFPTLACPSYKTLFQIERPLNSLLANYLAKKQDSKSKVLFQRNFANHSKKPLAK